MGQWVVFNQIKKFVEGTISSGTILDLKKYTNGMPWENEKVFLTMYSYLPDFSKMRYYAEAIPLGNNRYQIVCRLVGYDYTTAIRIPEMIVNPSQEWITLYSGAFYGVSYAYHNNGTFGIEGTHKAYANGNLFLEKHGDRNNRIAGYQGTYFSPTQQNGSIVVQQTGTIYGGKLMDIVIFTQPAEYKELLVNFIAIEED